MLKSEDTTNWFTVILIVVVVVHVAVGRSDVPGVVVVVLGRRPSTQF